ncbi:MAG: epoxyqueuosine reductase QueH [Lachnospiraceae bacterium]|nr:epoxyqueuosine reductase QueH [Lachnospiraceae bacterium]
MNKRNYQKELDKLIEALAAKRGAVPPHLFLHSCCAPCSSYVLEYLSPHFRITVFYYNPNITASQEYFKRVEEQKRLIDLLNTKEGHSPIAVVEGDYKPAVFLEMSQGLEQCPEGGERCFKCYHLRLEETAKRAKEHGADYFATTLTISPLKNAQKLNEIGDELALQYQVPWLTSDFKKRNGYKRSIELSAEYELYRQDYCGCAFSKAERERQKLSTCQNEKIRL